MVGSRDVKLVFFRNRSLSRDDQLLSDHQNNLHRFITGSKTVAVTNGCEAVSALLSAKRSSMAASRSRLKSASRPRTQPDHASLTSFVTSGIASKRVTLRYSALPT